jgi:hypothetical protein
MRNGTLQLADKARVKRGGPLKGQRVDALTENARVRGAQHTARELKQRRRHYLRFLGSEDW